MGQNLKTGILLFGTDYSVDTSLLENERIFLLESTMFAKLFGVKAPCQDRHNPGEQVQGLF